MDQKASISELNRQKKKQRVMRYFIDAAKELANESGMDSITIRSVADRAGYNSASLYNYFENLEQLKAFTSIDLMSAWLSDLANTVDSSDNELSKYLYGWESFVRHSFQNPAGFMYAYVTSDPDETIKYFEDYRVAFPDIFSDIPETLMHMFSQKTLEGQEKVMIEPCIDSGYILKEDAGDIYKLAHILHTGLLNISLRNNDPSKVEDYVHRYMRYFATYIQAKLQIPADLSKYINN